MKRKALLDAIDRELLERLFRFCYARTSATAEAQDLCSEILLALVKAANAEGDLGAVQPYIWRVARNVYADYASRRRAEAERRYAGDPDVALCEIAAPEETEEDDEQLAQILHAIAFLGRAYREVMIAYYLDGRPIAWIAAAQHTTENAVRQRLFAARSAIRNEVQNMNAQTIEKPMPLDRVEFTIWGTGTPASGDPRDGFVRQLSKHIVRLTMDKPRTAKEISDALHIPMLYAEEELSLLMRGKNGRYGLLRALPGGRYAPAAILLTPDEVKQAWDIYMRHAPQIADAASAYLVSHKADYMAFPYKNRRPTWNLILWQQIFPLADAYQQAVRRCLETHQLTGVTPSERPFTVFGYVANGKVWGGGWDSAEASELCGFRRVKADNISVSRIERHFFACSNLSANDGIRLALRAIDGLSVADLTAAEKEAAARAVQEGYLFREGDTLFTKILVSGEADDARLFELSERIASEFTAQAEETAAEIAAFLRAHVDPALHGDYVYLNQLAALPMIDTLIEAMIGRGVLTPPETTPGAEGVWLTVQR